MTVWSEHAIKEIEASIKKQSLLRDLMSTLKYPLATEKSVGIVDRGNNIITYIVDARASKKEIKEGIREDLQRKGQEHKHNQSAAKH
jgi:hypothetical protein